jgi:hypothetical protein
MLLHALHAEGGMDVWKQSIRTKGYDDLRTDLPPTFQVHLSNLPKQRRRILCTLEYHLRFVHWALHRATCTCLESTEFEVTTSTF